MIPSQEETDENGRKQESAGAPNSETGEIQLSASTGPIDQATANFILNGPASMQQSAARPALGAGWIYAFTRIHRIPVFKRVWIYLFFMAVYTAVVDAYIDRSLPHLVLKEAGAAAYSSVVLGLLLVFRTNTAYERWNEGRKLWGQLVNDSRTICFKVQAFLPVPEAEKMHFGQLVISFAYALKHHLRNTKPSEPLPGLGRFPHEANHLPLHITGKIFDLFETWKQAGYLDTLTLIQFDSHLRAFMDICGACERIKNSPIAVSYRAFMRQGIILNLLIVPWFMAPEYSLFWCLPFVLMGTYFLIGLELIAEDIEEPFGYDGDDLPLDTICGTIRKSVSEIMGLHKQLKFTRSAENTVADPLRH